MLLVLATTSCRSILGLLVLKVDDLHALQTGLFGASRSIPPLLQLLVLWLYGACHGFHQII